MLELFTSLFQLYIFVRGGRGWPSETLGRSVNFHLCHLPDISHCLHRDNTSVAKATTLGARRAGGPPQGHRGRRVAVRPWGVGGGRTETSPLHSEEPSPDRPAGRVPLGA